MRRSERRERLLDTALELFAAGGYHGVGIDAILARAGVSKKTLYRHFRSKDELVLAALGKYDGRFRNELRRRVEARARGPRARLLALFDVAGEWFEARDFHGCLFVNAAGEYAPGDAPIRRACRAFKAALRDDIARDAAGLGVAAPGALADQLALLLEGATVTAQVSGGGARAARTAKAAAAALIDRALGEGGKEAVK